MKLFITTLLTFFLSCNAYSQSKTYTLFDHQTDEVYGYFAFTYIDKLSKNEHLYQVTVLDINLKTVNSTTFKHEDEIYISNIQYNGNSVYFEIFKPGGVGFFTGTRKIKDYSSRIYDIASNTVSPRFDLPYKDKNINIKSCVPIFNKGYMLTVYNEKTEHNIFYAFDNNFNELSITYPYGKSEKKKSDENINIGDFNNSLLITINYNENKAVEKNIYCSLLFYDLETSKTIKTLRLDTDSYNVEPNSIDITKDKIYVYGDMFPKNQKIEKGKTSGVFRSILDLQGNILETKTLDWSKFSGILDIKESGFVKKKGFVYTHNFIRDPKTENTIIVGEFFKGTMTGVNIYDLAFLELDKDFNIKQFKEFEKAKTHFDLGTYKFSSSRAYGKLLENYGYFDYLFNGKLDNNKGLVFYYYDLERSAGLFKKGKMKYGIVVYENGNFTATELKWKRGIFDSTWMMISPSKPGYFMITSYSKEHGFENRLEKIEY